MAGSAGRYTAGVAFSAFLLGGGFLRKRHRPLLREILAHFGLDRERPPVELPSIDLQHFFETPVPVVVERPLGRDGNVSLIELLVLAQIAAKRRPAAIFEIGTFDGRTTLNFAANTVGDVFTLDLPAAQGSHTALPLDPSDGSYIAKPQSGALFADRPQARRITQLYGDSATFDFGKWEGRIDLVFIDGAHSREYVLSDTERALRLLRPKGGTILWHDYDAYFDGVTTAINEIARRGLDIRRIEGTSLAILETGDMGSGD